MDDPRIQSLIEDLAREFESQAPSPARLAAIAQSIIATGTTQTVPLLLACRAASLAACEGQACSFNPISVLRSIVQREPDHVEARVELGIALDVYAHAADEAISHLEHALAIEPTQDCVLGLARLYCEKGSRRRALSLIRAHPEAWQTSEGRKLEREISSGDWDALNAGDDQHGSS